MILLAFPRRMSNPGNMTRPENSLHPPVVKDEPFDVQTYSQPLHFTVPSFSAQYGIPRRPYPIVPPGLIFGTGSAGAVVADRERRSIGSYTQGPLPSVLPPYRASIQSEFGRQASKGISSQKGRMHWYPWQVEALLKAKKAEWKEQGRGPLVSADMKWERIQKFLRERGISAEVNQLKTKWDSVLGLWKSVMKWNHTSGNPSYLSMTRTERKKAKLPLMFPGKWSELIDSFYGRRPPTQSPCVADSSTIGNPDTPDATHEVPIPVEVEDAPDATNEDPIEAEDDNQSTAAESAADRAPVRSVSGVKRKKNLSQSASAIADCLSTFSDSLMEIENRRAEMEYKRSKWCKSAEERRVSAANERSAQLCSVLSLIARGLERLADTFPVSAPNQTPPSTE